MFLHANGHARLMLGLPWLKGLPIVATIHDPVPHPGESTWVRRFAGRMLRRRADHFILHGESLCDEYERVWGVPRARMSAIPHGVLAYRAWQDEAVKPPAGRYVLLFGRIRPYKGIPVLIEAARRMRTPPESLQIVIAGRGDDMAPHLDHIERAEQRERFVILNEFLSESMIDALHRHARAVVLPYTQASQSGPAATALEYGQPVIASEIGGLPDVVREGETGLLVPPGDAEALAGALDRIAEDDGLRERLSAGARRVATDELSWKALAGPTMAALKRGIEAHRRGGN
jgi:glycosyltransferase involved in cell wall biosynthesis